MRTKFKSNIHAKHHSFGVVSAVAFILQFGMLAGSAQTGIYLFTGSETTITLNPGLYDITAYGAQGGTGSIPFNTAGGLGAEMSGEFYFSANTTLTLLVGGAGDGSGGGGAWGGTSAFAGGGGGSIIDSSAIMDVAEVSGVDSPGDSPNGEIIITPVPEPTTLALAGLSGLFWLLFRRQRK